MPITAFNHFTLVAERELLDQLRDFYVEVVGLRVGERPAIPVPGYWLYLGEQAVLHLVETAGAARPGSPRSGTFDHVAFTGHDLPAVEAHLTAAGVPYRRTGGAGYPLTQLFVVDPAGNGVEFNFPHGVD